ncbi:MAG: hypothetical protein ACK42D_04980 [Candidatus Paceibacteria bacterium]
MPGAHAAADTWDDIPRAAVEALDLWFEDAEDMEPTPIDVLRSQPEVAAALADGAMHHDQHLIAGAVADAAVAPRVRGGDCGHGSAVSVSATTRLPPSRVCPSWGEGDRV